MKDCFFTDTEGCALPSDEFGPNFRVSLSADYLTKGDFYMGLSVPMYFETDSGQVYNSCGVLTASFSELLMDYLQTARQNDGGKSLSGFAEMLDEFAEQADILAEQIHQEEAGKLAERYSRTDWFPGDVAPAHAGVYEWDQFPFQFHYFNGLVWSGTPAESTQGAVKNAHVPLDDYYLKTCFKGWRGLTRKLSFAEMAHEMDVTEVES